MRTKTVLVILVILTGIMFVVGGFLLQRAIFLSRETHEQVAQILSRVSYPATAINDKMVLSNEFFEKFLPVIAEIYRKQGCEVIESEKRVHVTCLLDMWQENVWLLEKLKDLPIDISELCFGRKCGGCKLIIEPVKDK